MLNIELDLLMDLDLDLDQDLDLDLGADLELDNYLPMSLKLKLHCRKQTDPPSNITITWGTCDYASLGPGRYYNWFRAN